MSTVVAAERKHALYFGYTRGWGHFLCGLDGPRTGLDCNVAGGIWWKRRGCRVSQAPYNEATEVGSPQSATRNARASRRAETVLGA